MLTFLNTSKSSVQGLVQCLIGRKMCIYRKSSASDTASHDPESNHFGHLVRP